MRVLVACVGNIFLGDDAFGVEVGRALAGPLLSAESAAHEVRLRDFGVRAFDLACALAEGWDEVLLVDACARGKPPGTVFVLEAEMPAAPGDAAASAHSLDPAAALALARSLGGAPPGRVRVVACEPRRLAGEDGDIAPGLSPEVEAAVAPAAALVRSLVAEALQEAQAHA